MRPLCTESKRAPSLQENQLPWWCLDIEAIQTRESRSGRAVVRRQTLLYLCEALQNVAKSGCQCHSRGQGRSSPTRGSRSAQSEGGFPSWQKVEVAFNKHSEPKRVSISCVDIMAKLLTNPVVSPRSATKIVHIVRSVFISSNRKISH